MEVKPKEGNEKITIRQSLLLIVGFVLIFFWHNAPMPALAPLAVSEYKKPVVERLTIPVLSVTAPLVYATSQNEADIQFFLRSGVVHLYGTAEPGEAGNCYIVGHSSDYENARGDYKNIFAGLPEINIGDEISLGAWDETYKYKVLYTKVVEPDNLSVLSQDTGGRKLLTLQTSYPIGSAKQRFLVVAEQMEK